MSKRNKYVDIGILVVSIFLIGLFVNWQIANESFMINGTIGMFLFSISLIFKILRFKMGQYLLFILLLILLFNIKLSFHITNGDVSRTYYSENFSLGFNSIIFLVLILYLAVNRTVIVGLFKRVFYGSDKEQEEKKDKNIAFYYDKFNSCSSDELDSVLKMYKEYPAEAQAAISKIISERKEK